MPAKKVKDPQNKQLGRAKLAIGARDIPNKIFLKHWDEVITSKFLGLEKNGQWLTVKLDGSTLIFPIESLEAKLLVENLKGLKGKSIGILRTDSVERPIMVRIVERNENQSINQQKAPSESTSTGIR